MKDINQVQFQQVNRNNISMNCRDYDLLKWHSGRYIKLQILPHISMNQVLVVNWNRQVENRQNEQGDIYKNIEDMKDINQVGTI